jgi:phosphate transport system protein
MSDRPHIDPKFDEELALLRRRLLVMAGRVEEMVDDSCHALLHLGAGRPSVSRSRDRQVNQDECDIDDACMRLLARWQPTATDLRFVMLCLKVVTDLERLGDLTVNMGERTEELMQRGYRGSLMGIPELAKATAAMVHMAIDALARVDGVRAQVVIDRDNAVDEMHKRLFRDLLDRMAVPIHDVEAMVSLQSVGKYLERMADHATNIAEQVIFLVNSRDVRHLSNRVNSDPS